MQDDPAQHFSSHAEFEAHFRTSLARSHLRLDLFDPDFSVWPLGVSDVDAALRHFLSGGGQMRLVMHKSDHVRQHYPRFMRSLKDFSHALETRVTGKGLRHLTDSFCVGDNLHVVRRYHCEHMRGEAVFEAPVLAEPWAERFEAIWTEADPGIHATTLGL